MKNWQVYLLLCADATFYCGITNNLEKRLKQHNGILQGGARYTCSRRPVSVAFTISCTDKSQALKLENHIKRLPKHTKLAFFQNYARN